MKKVTVILLIIAAGLVVVGLALCAVGLALATGSLSWQGLSKQLTTNETVISEEISILDLNTSVSDVEILPATDGITKVVCYENPERPHEIFAENGKLTVRDTPVKWYETITIFGIGSYDPKLTVYLADTELESLTVNSSTGDVRVAKQISLGSATISATTADVSLASSVANTLSVSVTTGDIFLTDASCGDAIISCTTGKISLNNVRAKALTMKSSTGTIEASSVTCQSIFTESTTGDQSYRSLIVAEGLTMESGTGDIMLDGCDAAEAKINATTGDVTGRFLTDKIFFPNTTTGDVNVPRSMTGGPCEITTTTGDIEFSAP